MTRTALRLGGRNKVLARTITAASDDRPFAARRWPFASMRREKSRTARGRIGVYGLFGCGNLGNDGSLEATLTFLRQARSDADIMCICAGPQHVARELRVPAVSIGFPQPSNALLRVLLEWPRKLGSFVRAIWYARRLGLLIVAGGGQLSDLPCGPSIAISLFAWCVAARLWGAKIAFVSVGAGPIDHPLSRRLLKLAAAMADYRSYRDTSSKAFMESIGFDARHDEVYPDIAFKLPAPEPSQRQAADHRPLVVGVGVVDQGWIRRAACYEGYLDSLMTFVLWLLDQGHAVRILAGDYMMDRRVVDDLVSGVASARPDLAPDRLVAEASYSLPDLMRQIAATDVVVATRFHNVVCALRLAKPTVSIGYAEKNDVLMAEMGLGRFCQRVERLNLDLLMQQFSELVSDRSRYVQGLHAMNVLYQDRLARQDAALAACLP
jgi:polysaccharide pyruvyl transferase WcaK-like protein